MLLKMGLMLVAVLIWGGGFVATKWSLVGIGPIWAHCLRFILSGIVVAPYIFKKRLLLKLDRRKWGAVITASLMVFSANLLQTAALKYTTTAKAGFISSSYVLITPLFLILVFKKKFQSSYWALIGLCLAGLLLLSDLDFSKFNIGDLYATACAFFFSGHILLLDRLIRKEFGGRAFELNALQFFLAGVISVPYGMIFGGYFDPAILWSPGFLTTTSPFMGLMYLVFLSSLLAYSIQIHVQKTLNPEIVGPIFLMESPFAATMAYFMLGEVLSTANIVGACLLVLSVGMVPYSAREVKKTKKLRTIENTLLDH